MVDYSYLTNKEKINLLETEIQKIEHEISICNLVYNSHAEDTYEDLFRDNVPLLKEKIKGIKFAIKYIEEESDSE